MGGGKLIDRYVDQKALPLVTWKEREMTLVTDVPENKPTWVESS